MMKKQHRHLIILIALLMLTAGNAPLFAQHEHHERDNDHGQAKATISFNINKGNVTFTNSSYSGKDSAGNTVSGTHNASNVYEITGTSSQYVIQVGTSSTAVTSNFIIYLNGVNIDAPHPNGSGHAPAIYVNNSSGTVYLILKDGSTNTVKAYGRCSGTTYAHAAIEKEINSAGNLVVTCEQGYTAYTEDSDHNAGHTCTTSDNCGSLTATGYGDAKLDGYTYFYSGAAIGSAGGKDGTLNGLVIAGGKITANMAFSNLGGGSPSGEAAGNAAPGIGVGAATLYSGPHPAGNIKITGGKIDSQAGSGAASCIGGGFRTGNITVNIYGGDITATRRAQSFDVWSSTTYRGAGIGSGGGGTGTASTGTGTINIYGGTITASSQYGAAIGGGGGGESGIAATVTISGGTVNANIINGGNAAAIGSCGSGNGHASPNATVTINRSSSYASSTIVTTSGGGIGAGDSYAGDGGDATVSISGGTVTTSYIGGGNSTYYDDSTTPVSATTGNGGNANITISGGTVHVDGGEVGGGSSAGTGNGGNLSIKVSSSGQLYCHHISAGDIGIDNEDSSSPNTPGEIVGSGSAAGFQKSGSGRVITGHIRGGIGAGRYGKVTATISGGTVQGQFYMSKTNPTADDHCSFSMTGGTIDNAGQQSSSGTDYPRYTDYGGGAVYLVDAYSTINISGGTIRNCSGAGRGGAIYFTSGNSFTMSGGTLENNRATYGGAVFLTNATSASNQMSGGNVINNWCSNEGGGFCISSSSILTISGGTLSGNFGGTYGGAIYMNCNSVTISGTTSITGNSAGMRGGGIDYYNKGTLNMSGTGLTIKDNTLNGAPNNVYMKTGYTITVNDFFSPVYLGVYNEQTETPIPVFTSSSTLTSLNTGINNGSRKIYDDKQLHNETSLSNSNKQVNFTGQPWTRRQRQVSAMPTKVGEVYQIGSVEDLTAFLWYVNNIDTYQNFAGSAQPAAQGKLTADIDMKDQYWVPISTGYTGSFDGNGYTISNLTMAPTNVSSGRGLFGVNTSGTITNVILKDCYFGSETASTNLGGIVSDNRGTVSNSVVDGSFYASNNTCVIGGVAGANSGTIHSCYAVPEMKGYQMGGLVGSNSGNISNSFANPKFTYSGASKYFGGLVGVNTGRVENCYVRMQGTAPSSTCFGWLTGNNTSTADKGLYYCYSPNSKYVATVDGTTTGNRVGLGTYGVTKVPCLYKHRDSQVNITLGTNPYVSSIADADKQILIALNNWVTAKGYTTYTYWLRPWQTDDSKKYINDDLPLLRFPATNAVAATSGDPYLDYNQVNDLLSTYTTASDAICFYGKESSMNSNASSAAKLYIDQEAVLKPADSKAAGDIIATVGILLDNSAGADGAQPTQGGEDAIDWHMFSTSLAAAPLGVNYNGDTEEWGFSWGAPPSGMPLYQFYPEGNANHGYFPSTDFSGNDYYYDWDYYAYFEPEYHWINFKRNGNSHWHEDYNTTKINYKSNGTGADWTNESTLIKGRGYLLATKEPTYLQCSGMLNQGNFTVDVTSGAWQRKGYNLLGNPYQSYLDFNEFAKKNKALWGITDTDYSTAYYFILDEDQKGYIKYAYDASPNEYTAPRYLHPHQGFMVVADSDMTVTFDEAMRNTAATGVTFRGEGSAQLAYPLVNLIATEDNGNRDVCTVELGRPDKGGAAVQRGMRISNGLVYCHYDDKDWSIAFTQTGITEVAIRFETVKDTEFTMTWDIEHGEFGYLHLIDNKTGADIDCLQATEYRFAASTNDYVSRFRLVFDYTGIEEDENDMATSSSFAFVMGDQLIINGEGMLQLYDMTGRLLMQREVNGTQSAFDLPDVMAGVYVLRINDKNGMKTQKIILE